MSEALNEQQQFATHMLRNQILQHAIALIEEFYRRYPEVRVLFSLNVNACLRDDNDDEEER